MLMIQFKNMINYVKKNGFLWGVTKVTPKTDDNCFSFNYQFCQAIDLTNDDDVAELCDPTVKVAEWNFN